MSHINAYNSQPDSNQSCLTPKPVVLNAAHAGVYRILFSSLLLQWFKREILKFSIINQRGFSEKVVFELSVQDGIREGRKEESILKGAWV